MEKKSNNPKGGTNPQTPTPMTFMDHIQELKSRLFWVAICFAIASGLVYPFFGSLVKLLVAPLGDYELYYLTPSGGLSFIIKVCMYVGFLGALPAVVYHLYRFVAPVMKKHNLRQVVGFTAASALLAMLGIAFAYLISLPAALHFLTDFNIDQVSAMLTIDSYLSFIIAYLLAGAILFQLPLIIMIINTMTPLSPKRLMSYQRHIIIASVVLAAVLSPTPDVVNQLILAAPMVVMYQLSIILVYFKRRGDKRVARPAKTVVRPVSPVATPTKTSQPLKSSIQPVMQTMAAKRPIRSMEFVSTGHRPTTSRVVVPPRPSNAIRKSIQQPRRSIDGFVVSSTT